MRKLLPFAALVLVLVGGCGLKKADFVGSYYGLQYHPYNDASGETTRTTLYLTLNKDDTFEMRFQDTHYRLHLSRDTGERVIGGSWSLEGDKLTLRVETSEGIYIPHEEQYSVTLTVKEHAKVFEGNLPGGEAPVVFRRIVS